VSGVPPNLELLPFYWCLLYTVRYRQVIIFQPIGVPPNFFNGLKGAANQKRLKNTDVDNEDDQARVTKAPLLLSYFDQYFSP
jgi:hypothetical protein